jgi:hypothetical protein
MKIQALYDGAGTIIAAVEIYDGYAGPVPVSADGAEMAHFDVPETLAGSTLEEICRTVRVDPASRALVSR